MRWNTVLYDQEHGFVSKYGEALVDMLQPKPGERILDLGCGTGDLAHQLALSGCEVTGIDASGDMIEGAKAKYTDVSFVCADACCFDLKEQFDAVFSNAVLHWIRDQNAVLSRIAAHLRRGGRFVAELGAEGNVEKIRKTIHTILDEHGYTKQAAIRKWYFPSVAEYAALLEKHDFSICFMEVYDRPTVLKNTEEGIISWLEMFAADFFEGISREEKQKLIYEIQDRLYNDLYQKGEWVADYKRLRFCAIKKKGRIINKLINQ